MNVYKIIIPPSRNAQIKLNKYTFSSKADAISALEKALDKAGKKFTVEESPEIIKFFTEPGGEFATIRTNRAVRWAPRDNSRR